MIQGRDLEDCELPFHPHQFPAQIHVGPVTVELIPVIGGLLFV